MYTLTGLAKKEGTTANYLRTVITRLKKHEKALEWRAYRFILTGREWLAVDKDSDIQLIE